MQDPNIDKLTAFDVFDVVLLCQLSEENLRYSGAKHNAFFLRKLAKQDYIKYVEGSEFIDTREDLIEMGDPDGKAQCFLDLAFSRSC
jgi:hypothetical protein